MIDSIATQFATQLSRLGDFLSTDPHGIVTALSWVIGLPSALFLAWFVLWVTGVLDLLGWEIDDLRIYWREEGMARLRVYLMFSRGDKRVVPTTARVLGPYFATSYLYPVDDFSHSERRYDYGKAVLVALAVVVGIVAVLWAMGEL